MKRRRKIASFLENGLPIQVELAERAAITATLKVERGKRMVTIASAKTKLAVEGDVPLELRPAKRAEKLLGGAERVQAKLTVETTNGDGDGTVLKRTVSA